ncbi:hypothetical protein OESDEN_02360 [Oesophagostomum dentatum]|uniref:Uncharacterized protein n=1 Tax=Oesophagostomum dentatum TaxID=61180 RepID=A0A0B1TKB7_OESDE|nr:hypothetical protein OESDEN_02360 [Oesophagostomum dentatum]
MRLRMVGSAHTPLAQQCRIGDEFRRHNLKKGNNAKNPIVRGSPFWFVNAGEEEEMAEDDYPVDIEAIEKVMNNFGEIENL